MPNASNFFYKNLEIILNNDPVSRINGYSKSNSLKLIVDYFTQYIDAVEISSETSKKLISFAASFLTAYCPKLENLSSNDTENLHSYFNFLAVLQAKTQNISMAHPNLAPHPLLATPALNMSNVAELSHSCSQLNLFNPVVIDANTDFKIHHAAFGLPLKLSTGFGLGAAVGAFESTMLILTHIMERYQFSSTAIKSTRIMLGILNSFGISLLPFVYSFIKNLVEQENHPFNEESLLLTSMYAYISTFSLHLIKNIVLRSERGENYLMHHSALKLFLNALPLLGSLFIVANTHESLLEGMAIALSSFLGALVPNLATQFALGFFPNKTEEHSSNKPINISFIEGAITGLELGALKFPLATQPHNSHTQQITNLNNVESVGELNSEVISTAKVKTQTHASTQIGVSTYSHSSSMFKKPARIPKSKGLLKIIQPTQTLQPTPTF